MGVGGGLRFSGKKRYEGVRFNVISVTRGWVGVQFPEKSVTYVTLEWPLGDEIECFVGKTVVIVVRGSDTCSGF